MSAPRASAAPPSKHPPHPADLDFTAGLRWSAIAHVVLFVLVIFKSLVFPGDPVPFVPTLRVDIVGLPDILKKDLAHMPKATGSLQEIQKALDKADVEIKKSMEAAKKKAEVKEKADPAEMTLKPKRAATEDNKARQKRLQGALARIKALEKISAETASETPQPGVLIKGNRLSKGTSLSGDALESAQMSYYDTLQSELQEFWTLPPHVARQNLAAQVIVFIDNRGRLRNFRFTKLSGNPVFDAAVKRSIMESQPFPIPPEELAAKLMVDGILVGFPL